MLGELCKQIKHCRASLSDNFAEQKKCWELLAQNFVQFQTLGIKVIPTTSSNMQLHVTSNNVGSCWPTVLNSFAQALQRKIRFRLSFNSYLALYLSIWACGTRSIKSRPSLILRSISYFSRPLTYSKRNSRNITATKHLQIKLCPSNEIH